MKTLPVAELSAELARLCTAHSERVAKAARALCALAERLHKVSETECNYGCTPTLEKERTRLVDRANRVLLDLGIKGVSVWSSGDPRGYCLHLGAPFAPNTWGGTESGRGI